MNSSVSETTSLYWIKEHSLYVLNDSHSARLLVGMGCLWFVRIFFGCTMHTWFFFSLELVMHWTFFFLLGRLQDIFFRSSTPPPPSKAKWFAPNCAWRFSFKQEIRTRHEVPSWLKIDSRQPTRPRNTSLTAQFFRVHTNIFQNNTHYTHLHDYYIYILNLLHLLNVKHWQYSHRQVLVKIRLLSISKLFVYCCHSNFDFTKSYILTNFNL